MGGKCEKKNYLIFKPVFDISIFLVSVSVSRIFFSRSQFLYIYIVAMLKFLEWIQFKLRINITTCILEVYNKIRIGLFKCHMFDQTINMHAQNIKHHSV